VENYVFNVEKIWPVENYIFSQEAALEFLMNNNYNIEESVKKIQERSLDLELFLQGMTNILTKLEKKLNKENHSNVMDQIYVISGKISKRIHFR
jgi:hypothetical protein